MDMKWWVIGVCIIVILGISGWIWQDVRISPSELPICHTLQEGVDGGPSLVFFGSKEETERYMNVLYGVKPFDEAKDRFTVSYIDSVVPTCELYKGIALLCYSRELVQQAAACEHEYIVVLQEQPAVIRSSAFKGVISLNTAHQLSVFAHEFGHAFGDFAEEYTPASLPSSSDNCQASCDDFAVSDGCYQGCSETGYYRSIDLGIMRSLQTTQYGIWHEAYLRDLLGVQGSSSITGNAIAPGDCATQSYSLVHLVKRDGKTIIQGVSAETGCALPVSTVETTSFQIFTDAQEIHALQLTGETFAFEGDLFIPVSGAVETLAIKTNGQLVGEVHLGATLCRA